MPEEHPSGESEDGRQLPARYPRYPEIEHPAPQQDVFGYAEEEDAIQLLDLWRVVVVRRWTILAVALTFVTITGIGTYKQVDIYQATTRIQIDRENPNILSFRDVYSIESVTDDALQTQFEILEARALARRVIEDLRLAQHPDFQPGEPSALDTAIQSITNVFATDDSSEVPARIPERNDGMRELITAYLGRLTVTPVPQSRLVDVSFNSPDPDFAAEAINAHARHFIEQNLQFKFDATQDASIFLEQQLVTLQADLERAEDRLQEYSVANDILFTPDGLNTAMAKLQQLESEFTVAQSDRFQKESYRGLIESESASALPQLMDDNLISLLTTGLVELQRLEADLAVTFTPEYPQRQRIRSQIEGIQETIESEKQRIIETIRLEYSAAFGREELLQIQVEKQLNIVNRINQEIIQYNILKREADSNKQLYNGLLTRLKEAGISAGLRASNIRVVDRAETPAAPVSPRRRRNLALGLLVGLTMGIGLSFFQDYLDNSIKSPDDVTRYLQVPTIAVVPRRASLTGKHSHYGHYGAPDDKSKSLQGLESSIELLSFESPASSMAEAYRSMRTSLLLSSPDQAPRTIVITSATPSEGKTVTAINLATSLTQIGARVVLVDADMRRPRIHSVFALGATPGLTAVLTGGATLKETLHEVSVPNLFVLPCGVVAPNPAELLMSDGFQRTLVALKDYFDYVVIDSPPVANVSDPRIVARHADCTLLVIKAGTTSRRAAENAAQTLRSAQARIAGVVLNDLDVTMKGYDYSYYSGQYLYGSYENGGPPPKSA